MNETIPDVTAVDWDNPLLFDLVEAHEDTSEDTESDGSSIASVPIHSRWISMRLNMQIVGPSSNSVVHRWKLYKMPDGEQLQTSATMLTDSGFHVSNDDPTAREARKYELAKGILITNASTGVTPLRIFVRREAMRRAASFRENDKIRLAIAKDATGISSTLHGFGSLWFRANA